MRPYLQPLLEEFYELLYSGMSITTATGEKIERHRCCMCILYCMVYTANSACSPYVECPVLQECPVLRDCMGCLVWGTCPALRGLHVLHCMGFLSCGVHMLC
jgi:hypothetical protein